MLNFCEMALDVHEICIENIRGRWPHLVEWRWSGKKKWPARYEKKYTGEMHRWPHLVEWRWSGGDKEKPYIGILSDIE